MKRCSHCKKDLDESCFGNSKIRKDGLAKTCKPCQREADRKSYWKHREHRIAKNRAYGAAHPDLVAKASESWRRRNLERTAENARNWRKRNPWKKYPLSAEDKVAAQEERKAAQIKVPPYLSRKRTKKPKPTYAETKHLALAWRRNNPEKAALQVENRRAAKKVGGGKITSEELISLFMFYGNKCLACGKRKTEATLSMDHVIPLSKGGLHHIENIQPLCLSCNCSKQAKTTDYRRLFLEQRFPRGGIYGFAVGEVEDIREVNIDMESVRSGLIRVGQPLTEQQLKVKQIAAQWMKARMSDESTGV